MPQRHSLVTFLASAVLAVGLCAAPVRAGDDTYSYARIVRLSLATGDVQVARPDQTKWEPAFANMPIQQGFAVGTNNGRAEIEFENGGAIWLAERSVLQFTELALSDGGRITKVTLTQGTATFDANLATGDSFAVSTPLLQIMPPGKSIFRVDVLNGGGSVSVFKGGVSVTSGVGSQEVEKGESLTLNANAAGQMAINKNPSPDNWDRWVNSRESTMTNGANQSLQYTNAPFGYGMADLSMYGGWNFFPGYGYGWQPWGIGSGWAPFFDGQWMLYPGLGLTWVSFEPWGWVPYHFGQWVFSPAFGWMWMPGGYGFWNPAPVQWYTVGNRIGWAPVHPVNVTGATTVPVIVSTKSLGKEGPNRILTADKIGEKLQVLQTAPLSKGKMRTPTLAVPTAANLEVLRSSVGADAAKAGFVSAAPAVRAISSKPVLMNAAPPGRLITGRPPVRSVPASMPSQPTYRMPTYSPARSRSTQMPSTQIPSSRAPSAPRSAPSQGRPH